MSHRVFWIFRTFCVYICIDMFELPCFFNLGDGICFKCPGHLNKWPCHLLFIVIFLIVAFVIQVLLFFIIILPRAWNRNSACSSSSTSASQSTREVLACLGRLTPEKDFLQMQNVLSSTSSRFTDVQILAAFQKYINCICTLQMSKERFCM